MAKSFYTTGTGNEQTLTPIINEKVPIYDTIADAESDLANLEVGQIVKTKDAGLIANLNPIDEVKQGVFLPPTSNAVAKSLSYFTTEQKTGGKIVINGVEKDIYKCTFYSATNWADGALLGTISNIGIVLEIRDVTTYSSNNTVYQNYGEANSTTKSLAKVSLTNGQVTVVRAGGFANNLPSTVVIVYTKNE